MINISLLNFQNLQGLQKIPFKGVIESKKALSEPYLLAFDLDGTFLECNKKDIESFLELAKTKNCKLAYVSGRLAKELDAIREEYAAKGINIPMPDYMLSNNAQFLYENINGKLLPSEEYSAEISVKNFDRKAVLATVKSFIEANSTNGELALIQFDYSPSKFNVEYLVNSKIAGTLEKKLTEHLAKKGLKDYKLILDYVTPESTAKSLAALPESVQEKIKTLLDKDAGLYTLNITATNKAEGVEFLRKKLNIDCSRVVTAGNAGNDTSLAVSGFWFIVVSNAQKILTEFIQKLPQELKQKIIQASKDGVAGINEVLRTIFSKTLVNEK